MKPTDGNATQRRPNPSTQRPSEEVPTSAVFENQFNVLQLAKSAVSQSQVQREDRLIDPGSTRLRDYKLQEELKTKKLCQMKEFSTLYHY